MWPVRAMPRGLRTTGFGDAIARPFGNDPEMTERTSALIQLDGILVPRVGFGTMRLTGRGVLGPPLNMAEARGVVSRALELGVRVFDTAWYYGPDIPTRLLAEALSAHRIRIPGVARCIVGTK